MAESKGTTEENGEGLSRRKWIDILLGSSAVAWLAAVVFPVLKYLTPPVDEAGAGKATLTDAQRDELKAKGFLILRIGTDRVLAIKDGDVKVKALSAKCTHEGCTVQFQATEGLIWCACHNGKFNLDGRVLSGPPPRPLAAFAVAGDLTGAVTISKSGGAA
jgi:cytochrome b6-f complex iron-sulfur subunit